MALPRAAPPNWPDVEAPPIVRLGKCQGETKRDEAAAADTRRSQQRGDLLKLSQNQDSGIFHLGYTLKNEKNEYKQHFDPIDLLF